MAMDPDALLRSMKRSSVRMKMKKMRWKLDRIWSWAFINPIFQIELVVQGRTILVSEKLLCQHSLYFRWYSVMVQHQLTFYHCQASVQWLWWEPRDSRPEAQGAWGRRSSWWEAAGAALHDQEGISKVICFDLFIENNEVWVFSPKIIVNNLEFREPFPVL